MRMLFAALLIAGTVGAAVAHADSVCPTGSKLIVVWVNGKPVILGCFVPGPPPRLIPVH